MRSLLRLLFARRFFVVLLKGRSRWSDDDLSLFYWGKGESLAFLKTHLFAMEPHATPCGRYSLLQLLIGWRPRRSASVSVVELTPEVQKLLRVPSQVVLPDWIEHELDLRGDWKTVTQRFRRSTLTRDIPRIQRFNLTEDIVNDTSSVNDFYDTLYLPLLQERHGDSSVITPREWLLQRTGTYQLFRLQDEGECVAAAWFTIEDRTLNWVLVGMRQEVRTELKRHLQGILYYRMIRYAHEQGFESILLGTTRPLFTDGVYRHKRKWGATVIPTVQSDSTLFIRFDATESGVQHWLCNNPLLVENREAEELDILFIVCRPEWEASSLARLKEHYTPGPASLCLVTSSGQADAPARFENIPLKQIALDQLNQ